MRPIVLALLLSPALLSAQGAAGAAESFLAARGRGDWTGMAEFTDSAGRAAIRAEANRLVEQLTALQRPELRQTLEAARADAPLRILDASSSMFGGGSLLRLSFAGVTDSTMLRGLSDADLVARWFEARDYGYRSRLLMDGLLGDLVARVQGGDRVRSEVDSLMRVPTRWEIVGVVEDRALRAVAHVVYRLTAGGQTGVLSFRERDGRWYLAALDPAEQVDQLGRLEIVARQAMRNR